MVLLLFFVLLSYFFGRRIGLREGVEQGERSTFLLLRMESLQQGFCPICGSREGEVKKEEAVSYLER